MSCYKSSHFFYQHSKHFGNQNRVAVNLESASIIHLIGSWAEFQTCHGLHFAFRNNSMPLRAQYLKFKASLRFTVGEPWLLRQVQVLAAKFTHTKKTEQNTQHCIVTGIQQCKRKLCRRKVSHAMSCHDLPSMLAQNRNKINGKNNDKKSGIRKAIYSTINCYSRLHNTISQVRELGTNIFEWRPSHLYIPMIRWVTLMKIWFNCNSHFLNSPIKILKTKL